MAIHKTCVVCGTISDQARCPTHRTTTRPWGTSTRRASTLNGWAQQKRAKRILRDSTICHVCGLAGADQVDHVTPLAEGGADDDTNLKPIHRVPCHQRKTADEATRARRHHHPAPPRTPGG